MFEQELGLDFGKGSLNRSSRRLPELLVADLGMIRDCEMEVNGNNVRFNSLNRSTGPDEEEILGG